MIIREGDQVIYRYDDTFPGFLTAVFEVWNDGHPAIISPQSAPTGLFDKCVEVVTGKEQSERVWKGIERIGGIKLCRRFLHVFLSGEEGVENLLLRFLKRLFDANKDISANLNLEEVLHFTQLERKVLREVHRMAMFVRFEQAADGTWFAPVAPKYDVLPLAASHFKSRFSGQKWLIYDTQRDYGVFYNLNKVERVSISRPVFDEETGNLPPHLQSHDEQQWQTLWRTYFRQIAISERTNSYLQRQLMPKRFWRYLTEKKG